MFKAVKEAFGKFQQVTVKDEESGNAMRLVPEHGACLLDLKLNGTAVIDGYQTPMELDFNNWCKNRLLFPFPNRLKHGTYHWEDHIYQFPINDEQTGNALHGHGMEKPFRYTQLSIEKDKALVECSFKNQGDDPAYPFRYSINVSYEISIHHSFVIQLTFQNLHTRPIPVGIGWHPYFKLDEEGVNNLNLQLPPCEMIGIDPQMIPTGKRYAYDRFEQKRPIQVEVLDNCFALINPENKASVSLSNGKKELHYWQETGERKFNYLQVFTPPHRQSIALEPMTCNIDAFNNESGLVTLHPGERISTRCGVSLREIGA
ncbi:MAG: aldose 1-epimerase [Saprospiraceae bacterium]